VIAADANPVIVIVVNVIDVAKPAAQIIVNVAVKSAVLAAVIIAVKSVVVLAAVIIAVKSAAVLAAVIIAVKSAAALAAVVAVKGGVIFFDNFDYKIYKIKSKELYISLFYKIIIYFYKRNYIIN